MITHGDIVEYNMYDHQSWNTLAAMTIIHQLDYLNWIFNLTVVQYNRSILIEWQCNINGGL